MPGPSPPVMYTSEYTPWVIDSNAPFIQSILASPKDPKEILKWQKSKPVNFQKNNIYQGKNKQSDKNIILRLGDGRVRC